MPPTIYQPGQRVEISGLYRVVHYKHRESDSCTTFSAGTIFSHCQKCDDLIEYILLNPAKSEPAQNGAVTARGEPVTQPPGVVIVKRRRHWEDCWRFRVSSSAGQGF